jgi:hypothetical protein
VHRGSIWRRDAVRGRQRYDDCPSDEDLICLDSQVLSPEKSREIRRHVDRCSPCQAYLRELGTVYQATAIVTAEDGESPEPSAEQWVAFRRALRAQASLQPRSFLTFKRLLLVAAMLLAAMLPELIARATRYDAGTVVQRAVDREPSRGIAGRAGEPLRFRWIPQNKRDSSLKELSSAGRARKRASSSVSRGTEPTREIVSLLDSHGFDRQEPLSASRLAAWRSARSVRSDSVIRRDGLLHVRMTVPRGELREVIVVVREDDWRVVGQAWVFWDLGRLEVERLGSDVFSSRPRVRAPRNEGATQ